MLRTLMVAALLLAFAMPVAAAAPACVAGADAPAYVHTTASAREVWQETNGFPGLQRAACEDASGNGVAADTLVASVPIVPIPQDLCATVPVLQIRLCVI